MESTTELIRIQAQTVAELKKEIRELQDEYLRLKNSQQDTANVERQLAQANQLLNDTMKAGKKDADALDGSYDALAKKMAELKKEWKATNDEARRNELGKQIKDINNQLKGFDESIGNYQRNVGNYASALGNVKQVGGDMVNGFKSMASVIGLTAVQQDKLTDSEKAFTTVLGIAQGAKGILGMIEGLTKYKKTAKEAETAQKALNTAELAGAGATEAGAQAVSKFGAALQKAIPWLAAIAIAIGALAYYWDEVSSAISRWFGWEKKSKEETEKLTKANEKLNEELEESTHRHQNEMKVLKAKGASQKEILLLDKQEVEAQKKITQSTIDTVNARIAEIRTHGWLQRLINGENKERKALEEQLDELAETMKKLDQQTVDIEVDIQVADIEAGKAGAQKANQLTETLKKAAEKAKEYTQKLIDEGLAEEQVIVKKYEKIAEELKKAKDDETKYLDDQLKHRKISQQKYDEELAKIKARYDTADKQAQENQLKEQRAYWKQRFDTAYKGMQDVRAIATKNSEEVTKVYKGLISELTGMAQDANAYDKLVSDDKIRNLQMQIEDAFKVLEKQLGEDNEQIKELRSYLPETIEAMYQQILEDEKGFKERWQLDEPFITAIKSIGPHLAEIRTETTQQMARFVKGVMAEVDEQIGRENYGILPLLFKKMADNIPINQDPELQAALDDYIRGIYNEVTKKIVENDKLTFKDRRGLLDILGLTPEALKQAKTDLAIREIDTYSNATVNALNNITNAWNNIITAQQNALRHQLDAGEITQEQYDEMAEKMDRRLEKSFDVMKKVQYATTVIRTASGIMAVWAGEGETYYKAIMSAAVAAEGIAQLATIAGTYYNRSSSITTTVPTTTAPASVSTVGLGELTASLQQNQQPIKAYVLDQDLAEGLDNYHQRENETSF